MKMCDEAALADVASILAGILEFNYDLTSADLSGSSASNLNSRISFVSIKMIKDPIHGFIEFDSGFEDDLRKILGDQFFQRLRKVKQLGFSDHVFPSETHTHFAHSLGVYNTARRMLSVVEQPEVDGEWSMNGKACLAAALLHYIGTEYLAMPLKVLSSTFW